jgi:limonene-1,2-epoxide hydrolase
VTSDPEALTRDFFDSWSASFDSLVSSFGARLAVDCDWDQRPMLRTRTRDGALRFLRVCRRTIGLETVDVDMLSLAVSGSSTSRVVHTARTDHLRRKDGSLIASAPVAGVLTFSAGQIVHWKEYFDPAVFGGRAVGSIAAHAVRTPVRALRSRSR